MKTLIHKILRKLRLLGQQNGQGGRVRKDVEIIQIQPNLAFIVYWKVLKIGKGPALILRAFDKEIMKFDCFGKGKGHYHVVPEYHHRINFSEEIAIDQIHKSGQIILQTAQEYLSRQENNQINTIQIERKQLENAVQIAQEKMVHYLENVQQLEELR